MELFDYMARIIRLLIDHNFEAEWVMALAKDDYAGVSEKVERLTDADDGRWRYFLDHISEENYDGIFLLVMMQKLDEWAAEVMEKYFWDESIIPDHMKMIEALNQNSGETQIILMPRYDCIWNGKSRESNHITDINTYLRHVYYAEVCEGRLDGKYLIKNYILNPAFYGVTLGEDNRLFVRLAVSSLAKGLKLAVRTYTKRKDGYDVNYFSVDELACRDQEILVGNMERIILEADRQENRILVFPEMLGTQDMKDRILGRLSGMNLRHLYFLVFPSIWMRRENGIHVNRACVISGDGEEWFGQDKLTGFVWEDVRTGEKYIEDIGESDIIHIIHCSGYGSIAVVICRDELEESVKDILIKRLNVKLILCPSWTKGHHEFERSILTGVERNCNVAWCNSCSALEMWGVGGDEFDHKITRIISSFGKNPGYSSIDLKECEFPQEICDRKCKKGCFFSKTIYGVDYQQEGNEYAGEQKSE